MRLHLKRNCLLMCCALILSGLLFVGCGVVPNLERTSTVTSIDEEFSSALVDGEEFTVPSGQAIVMYADHLPQAGGSGNEAVSNDVLENQVKILANSPSFTQIPAVWGLLNHCTYTIYVDAYYVGTLRIAVVDAKLAHQILAKWSTDNSVASHYISENEIPCLAS